MTADNYTKLRLVKVIIQPVLVLDDGETLSEKTVEPVQVPASEWESYPARMVEEIKRTEAELNGEG